MPVQIVPSILAADFLNLGRDIEIINRAGDIIHLDIMDGTLVPNISFGFSVVDQVSRIARRPMDAHLMVVHPERWFEKLHKDNIDMVSFHYEAAGLNTSRYIREIQSSGMKAGVAINPDLPVRKLFPYIGKADYFLIMSVFAGFGGQKFIYETFDRVADLKAEISRRGAKGLVEIDGGVNMENIQAIRESGVDMIVAGSTVFKSENPEAAIAALRGI